MDEITMAHKLLNTTLLLGGGFVVCYALMYCAYGVGWCVARLLGWVPEDKSDEDASFFDGDGMH